MPRHCRELNMAGSAVLDGLIDVAAADQDFKGADWELLTLYVVPTKTDHVRVIVAEHLAGHIPWRHPPAGPHAAVVPPHENL